MAEHLTHNQILRYHMRALDTEELIGLDEHLAVCSKCRHELNAGGQGKDKFVSLQKDLDSASSMEHLDDEQLTAYADRSLSAVELETIKSHLAVCAKCELLAADLVAFRDEVVPNLSKEYQPAREMIQQATPPSRQQALATRLKSLFAFNSPAMAFGMGAFAMLVVVTVAWLFVRANRTGTTGPQVAQSSSPAQTASPLSGPQAGISPSPSPSPSPQILLALNDGAKQIGIDDKGNLVGFDDAPPATKEMIKAALITQQAVNLAALSGIGSQQGVLRGGQDKGSVFTPLNPVGKVIFSTRPTMRWSKLDGATEYRVEIYGSNSDLIASSPPLTSNSWEVPNDLNRGEVYSWQVTATKEGEKIKSPVPPAPEAKFKTLDVKQAAELTLARKSSSASHLTLGVLYAQAGLLDDAEREFTALASANPQSEIARKLLSNVRAAKSTAK